LHRKNRGDRCQIRPINVYNWGWLEERLKQERERRENMARTLELESLSEREESCGSKKRKAFGGKGRG